MTGQGFIDVFHDPKLHDYIIEFAKSNLSADQQEAFVKDVWCDIGRLPHEEPSLHLVAEVVWRRMIQYQPILAKLADGYTQDELAEELGGDRSRFSHKIKRLRHKNTLSRGIDIMGGE